MEKKSYLGSLIFDQNLKKGFVASYITNIRLVLLIILALFIGGIVSYISTPQRLNPEIKIPIVSVTTLLPGASPKDVESLITIPIEDKLNGIKGLDTISSVSTDNLSSITMQFVSGVSPEKAQADAQSIVDGIIDLPSDAKSPTVKAFDFEDVPVWTFSVKTALDTPSLMRFADKLKTSISQLAIVDRVLVSGLEQQEIQVIIDQNKIKEYGINPITLSSLIKKAGQSYPAGTIDTGSYNLSLTIDSDILNIQDIRNIRITSNGKVIKLSDIASVSEKSKSNQPQSFHATSKQEPQRSVTFSVYKTTSTDIILASNKIKEVVNGKIAEYNNKFSILTISNTGDKIQDQFNELLGEFKSTIILVFLCLLVFLGLRQALISSFTVPLTFLCAFIFVYITGMSINFLTMFAFLIALGLLIDDTIVVVSAMTTYYKTGRFTETETGLLVWKDFIVPIWSTTITTIWAFVPLLLSSGIIGEFIKPIPIIVTAVMISSTAIAMFIALPIMRIIINPHIPKRVTIAIKFVLALISLFFLISFILGSSIQKPYIYVFILLFIISFVLFFKHIYAGIDIVKNIFGGFYEKNDLFKKILSKISHIIDHGIIHIEVVGEAYKPMMRRILISKSLRRQVLWCVGLFTISAYALLPLGFVKNEFFPKSDGKNLYLNIEYPSNSNMKIVTKESLKLLEEIRDFETDQVKDLTLDIGKKQSSRMSSGGGTANTSLITLELKEEKDRSKKSMEIAENLRKQLANYNAGTISVLEESSGPPAGSDIQIKLLGDDLFVLDNNAERLMQFLRNEKGVANIEKTMKSGTSTITFIPDKNRLAEYGISADTVGLWMRFFASGFTLDSVKFDKSKKDKEDIVFRFDSEDQNTSKIQGLQIPIGKNYLPISSLGHFEMKTSPTQITRERGKRTISVTASTRPGYSNVEIGKKLEKEADKNTSQGYIWQTGGANEENAKSVKSIMQAMLLSIILILITIVIQFNSFRQAIIVLSVIPLAISSVFIIFALTGTPLSFPALIGVLSLFGIVVTNSMFVVDKINLNIREGMSFIESIVDAGGSRLEPIVLTKLCTILGLLPITLSDPTWRGLGGAVISGILVSSSIMLFFIPVFYYIMFHNETKNK